MIGSDVEALRAGATSIRGSFTSHAALERILRAVATLITRNNKGSEGPVHALVGMTRSGKSHLLRVFLEEHAKEPVKVTRPDGDFAFQKPVVYLKFLGNTTKGLTEAIYLAVTGNQAEAVLGKGCKQSHILDEIIRHRKECGVRLLILDEAHQSILNKSDHAAKEVAKLVKDLSNSFFSVLIVGTEELVRLINADPELQARVNKTHRIHPFTRDAADMHIWKKILDGMDDVLTRKVFGQTSHLSARDLAEALMTASGGTVGHMATLVENAAYEAIDQWDVLRKDAGGGLDHGPHAIGWDHFEIAFNDWAPGRMQNGNPFHPDARPPADEASASGEGAGPVRPAQAAKPPESTKSSNVRGRTARGATANRFKT